MEVHADEWWIKRMTAMGFVYSEVLTKEMRQSQGDGELTVTNPRNASDTKTYQTGQHINSMLAFINPHVASRPEHAHLFAEVCFALFLYSYFIISLIIFPVDLKQTSDLCPPSSFIPTHNIQ